MPATVRSHALLTTTFTAKNGWHHAKEGEHLRQGVLGWSCRCRNRTNDDLQSARQRGGQFMRMNKAQEARAMEGQGRAGRGWHTKTKEYLVAQLDERRFDLRRGYGVEKHHGKRRPSHPRQSSTSAHSMQQHSARCNRAHAPTRTETPRHPQTV